MLKITGLTAIDYPNQSPVGGGALRAGLVAGDQEAVRPRRVFPSLPIRIWIEDRVRALLWIVVLHPD